MRRDFLYPFKHIVLSNHEYLRVGDIIQIDQYRTPAGQTIPVVDAIESPTDPLIYQMNLNDSPYYGNIFCGDSLKQIQTQLANEALRQTPQPAPVAKTMVTQPVPAVGQCQEQTSLKQTAKKSSLIDDLNRRLHKVSVINQAQRADPNLREFKVLFVNFKHMNGGILMMGMFQDEETRGKIWGKKFFKFADRQQLNNYQKFVKPHYHVAGKIGDGAWIRYLKPHNQHEQLTK